MRNTGSSKKAGISIAKITPIINRQNAIRHILLAAAGQSTISQAGTGPGAWWLRRVAQVGAGKVFGSAGFVLRTASALGDRFRARGVGAHPVGEIGFSTHGWRLATAGA